MAAIVPAIFSTVIGGIVQKKAEKRAAKRQAEENARLARENALAPAPVEKDDVEAKEAVALESSRAEEVRSSKRRRTSVLGRSITKLNQSNSLLGGSKK